MSISKLIVQRHSVKFIACQLLFRENTRHILPSIYNGLVIRANKLLKHELATDSGVLIGIKKDLNKVNILTLMGHGHDFV